MTKKDWFLGIGIVTITIITFITLVQVLRLPNQYKCKCETRVIRIESDNSIKIKRILLEKYIFEHSKYSYNDPNIRRIIDAVDSAVDKYYQQLNYIGPTLFTEEQLKILVYSIIQVESRFDIYAISKSNAIGLMQILPNKINLEYINKFINIQNKKELFDINNNIEAGLILLNHHFEIAYKKLKNQNYNKVNLLKKALNIYSNDDSGKYAIRVIGIMTELKYFLKI